MRKIITGQILLLILLLYGGLNSFSCGKRGPSLPPIRVNPAKAGDLKVRQIGDSVILRFVVPQKNTDGSSIQGSLSASVLCSVEQVQEETSTFPSYDEFLKKAKIWLKIDPEALIQKTTKGMAHVEDNIFERYGEKALGKRFSYAIQLTDEKGKISPISNISSLITGKTLAAPTLLHAKVLEEGVQLSWEPPVSETDEKEEQLFNIYRLEVSSNGGSIYAEDREEETFSNLSELKEMEFLFEPINKQPVPETVYLDNSSLFGIYYLYSIRSLYEERDLFKESGNSNIIRIQPLDQFPPDAPQGLIAVAEGSVIRLFWYPNAEKDLGGYKIYRAPERSGPFSFIAETPPYITSYTDKEILLEKTWHYYLTAIDKAEPANESSASPIISEVALPQFNGQDLHENGEHEEE